MREWENLQRKGTDRMFMVRFKELRMLRGMTQGETAAVFGVTRPCICYWETGRRVPDFGKLMEICSFFDVSPDYLLGTDLEDGDYGPSDEVKQRYDYINIGELDDNERQQVRGFVEYLLSLHREGASSAKQTKRKTDSGRHSRQLTKKNTANV